MSAASISASRDLRLADGKLDRTLVRAVCAGFLTGPVLHLIFHASHLEGFGTVDGIAAVAASRLSQIGKRRGG